jgi:hypothetical protein
MGIIVNEPLTTKYGLELESYYIGLGDAHITLHRMSGNDDYTIEGEYRVWVSKEARDAKKKHVSVLNIQVTNETPFVENVYDVLYTKLKEGLTDYEDCI